MSAHGRPFPLARAGMLAAALLALATDATAQFIVFDDDHVQWTAGTQAFTGINADDVIAGTRIKEPAAGGNGPCDSSALGDDVQRIAVGAAAAAGAVCVGPGTDGVLQSPVNFAGPLDVWVNAADEIGHFCGRPENNAEPGTVRPVARWHAGRAACHGRSRRWERAGAHRGACRTHHMTHVSGDLSPPFSDRVGTRLPRGDVLPQPTPGDRSTSCPHTQRPDPRPAA